MITSCRSFKSILLAALCASLLASSTLRVEATDLEGVMIRNQNNNNHNNNQNLNNNNQNLNNNNNNNNNKNNGDKISVELYFESQCPGCRAVLTESFKEAFAAEGFLDMADITLVPYGNAKETGPTASGTYYYECQHGLSECIYNLIEACALFKIGDPLVAFAYLDCIERNDESRDPKQDYETVAMHCVAETGLDDETVHGMSTCASSAEGNLLQHDLATKTEALDPPHTYVPWIVVGGVHDDDVEEKIGTSLLDYVCSNYEGPNASPDCAGRRGSSQRGSKGKRKSESKSKSKSGTRNDQTRRTVCYRGAGAGAEGKGDRKDSETNLVLTEE
eukprot:CAMPEP_0172364814 /NCGR_PEP_ID=MMETSP1060-20121228/7856_1 /TAXON_ID=37318 /ORGANISM="Pseudo-nitzschia pungens, Strain cf. cingulata" /LENGTH=332 /DNA_ID=CAMNT_0013087913 /DNA_START=67 /DNA_END=1065 /DNA_ORIENTATION=-